MRIQDMNWMQVEQYLLEEDRCVLPLGCCEQHCTLSLATDTILAERMSLDAAEPLGIVVFPALSYGVTPTFMGYPGTITVSYATYCMLLTDLISSIAQHGFRRLLVVNGHGGNTPARASVQEWASKQNGFRIQWHDWWNAPLTLSKVKSIDPVASHASWMENFPWTRISEYPEPVGSKEPIEPSILKQLNATETRQYLGDGNFGGLYVRSDREMQSIWDTAIMETRQLLETGWFEPKV